MVAPTIKGLMYMAPQQYPRAWQISQALKQGLRIVNHHGVGKTAIHLHRVVMQRHK